MAMRTRQIHPRFWISESVASVGFFERLLFQALWGLADREGLLLYRPGEIRPQAFPHDSCVTRDSMVAGIAALEAARLVMIINRKDGTDDPAIYIPKFKEYQWVNKDEAKSKLIQHYFTWNPEQSIWIHTDPRQSSSYTLNLCTPIFNDSITPSHTVARKRSTKVVGVDEVVTYLNQITGRSFALDRGNEQIERVLKAGATVQDCRDVIDRCWRLWHDKPEMVANVNKVTPFRKSHFDVYLDEARAGAAKPGNGQPAKASPIRDDFVDFEQTGEERAAALEALSKLTGIARWA